MSSSCSAKPGFSKTCSLLSQYLKENGTFGDLSLGLSGEGVPAGTFTRAVTPTTTMNLFPTIEKLVDAPRDLTKPADLFTQPIRNEESCKSTDISIDAQNQPAGTAPMTIFYAGKVIVFDDLTADKVKEIMMLASKGSSSGSSDPHLVGLSNPNMAQNLMTPSDRHELIHCPADPIVRGDLPIARRASLHRFLEKRKDRIIAKSPYAVPNSEKTPPKLTGPNSWLGLQPNQRNSCL